MRAYSIDLRQRIVSAVERGTPRQEVADVFGVSLRTVDRYLARARRGQTLAPGHAPGRVPRLTAVHAAQILLQLEADPSATLAMHQQRLAETTGLRVSSATMWRAINRLGWTRKKGRWQPGNVIQSSGLPGGEALSTTRASG